jgi:Ca2+-binding EF-hand superfamily protein
MATKQQNPRRQPPAHPSRVVAQKQGNKLPDYLVSITKVDDLRAAVAIYETGDQPGVIQMNYVRGILWNFGFWRLTSKDFEKELISHDIDPKRTFLDWNELLSIVTRRYYQGGREQEIKDTFKIFDRKDRGTTTVVEIRNALQSKLEVPVTDSEVNEMFEMAGLDPSGVITLNDFMNV